MNNRKEYIYSKTSHKRFTFFVLSRTYKNTRYKIQIARYTLPTTQNIAYRSYYAFSSVFIFFSKQRTKLSKQFFIFFFLSVFFFFYSSIHNLSVASFILRTFIFFSAFCEEQFMKTKKCKKILFIWKEHNNSNNTNNKKWERILLILHTKLLSTSNNNNNNEKWIALFFFHFFLLHIYIFLLFSFHSIRYIQHYYVFSGLYWCTRFCIVSLFFIVVLHILYIVYTRKVVVSRFNLSMFFCC